MRNPLATLRAIFTRSRGRKVDPAGFGPPGFDEGGPARALAELSLEETAEDGLSEVTEEERAVLLGEETDTADGQELAIAGTVAWESDEPEATPALDDTPSKAPCDESDRPARPTRTEQMLEKMEEFETAREQRVVEAIGELGDLLGTIRLGLESQDQRQERLLVLFQGMPDVLAQMPQTSERQLEQLSRLHAEIAASNRQNAEVLEHLKCLPESLAGLPEAARTQTQLLQHLSDQTAIQSQQSQQMARSLSGTQQWLGEMSQTSQRQMRLMEEMEAARQQETGQIIEEMKNQNRRTVGLFVTAVAIASLALACVVVAGSMISELM